ncbi:MAG: 50S ribosomal protein L28 [Clostridiales bacterium]|nr:50S ribosomal protein L28 [Clostridiales bacterium]
MLVYTRFETKICGGNLMKACEICGKGRTTGNNVSHSMRHTKRTFDANIQKVDVEIDGKKGKKNICAKCLKTMKKEAK